MSKFPTILYLSCILTHSTLEYLLKSKFSSRGRTFCYIWFFNWLRLWFFFFGEIKQFAVKSLYFVVNTVRYFSFTRDNWGSIVDGCLEIMSVRVAMLNTSSVNVRLLTCYVHISRCVGLPLRDANSILFISFSGRLGCRYH